MLAPSAPLSRRAAVAVLSIAVLNPMLCAGPRGDGDSNEDDRNVQWTRVFLDAQTSGGIENGWDMLVFTIGRGNGMLDGFAAGSDIVREYLAGATAEVPREPWDMLTAVLGRLEPPDERLAAEGRRFVRSIDSSEIVYHLDELVKTRRFVPAPALSVAAFGPHWSATKIGLMLRARARVAWEEGDREAMLLSVRRGLAVARATSYGPVAGLLSGMTITQMMMDEVHRAAMAGAIDIPTARQLLADTFSHRLAPPSVTIGSERLSAHSTLEPVYREMEPELAGWKQSNQEVLDRFYSAWERWWTLEGEEAQRARDEAMSIFIEVDERSPALEPAAMVLPALGNLQRTRLRVAAKCAGVQVMLAAEIYKAEHGDYPDRAEALCPEIFAALPRDPFSPEGAPMRYKRLDSKADPQQRPYLVYSVGGDGRDDGGTEHPGGNINATVDAPKYAGSDYIINTVDY